MGRIFCIAIGLFVAAEWAKAQGPRSAASAGERHVVVQLAGVPTHAERERLAGRGVHLLDYLGEGMYFATLEAGQDEASRRFGAAVRGIAPQVAVRKQHAAFRDGTMPEWARFVGADGSEWNAALVLLHADVDLAEGVAACQRHDAIVRSVLWANHALVIELPQGNVGALAAEDAVQWIEPPLPPMSETNNDVRRATGAAEAQEAPYGLTGAGVGVLIYDSGTVWPTHADFGNRVRVRDASGSRPHATQVAGTLGGSGTSSSGLYKGMAPAVTIESYGFQTTETEVALYTDPGDLQNNYDAGINSWGDDLANNSIGSNIESNGYDCAWQGDYGVTANLLDAIACGSLGRPVPIVWSVGNERLTNRCDVEGFGDFYSIPPPAAAKNPIVVGAVNSDDLSMTDFSSWGPTDDGRIKPDIVAPGCQRTDDGGVTSCAKGGGYTVACSSSFATAATSGLVALMLQDWRAQFPGEPDPPGELIKAVLIHTARDEVAADDLTGPDYRYGWGVVDIVPALDLVRGGGFATGTVDQGETATYWVLVAAGIPELRLTLAWDDPPAAPAATQTLVNDLDLHVYDAAGNEHWPWTLDPGAPGVAAEQWQGDHTNNVEQVRVAAPQPGAYRIEVNGFAVAQGPQTFALCTTPAFMASTSAGVLLMSRTVYACNANVAIWLADSDLNVDPLTREAVDVLVQSDSTPAGVMQRLVEVGADVGLFAGTLALNWGGFNAIEGDTLTAQYVDADDGGGGTNVVVTATAGVDCTPPTISAVAVHDIETWTARFTFTTDEPALGLVSLGKYCGFANINGWGASNVTDHDIRVTRLTPDTAYRYVISAWDRAGNLTTDMAGGECYEFTTPPRPASFTQEFSGDFDLDGYSVTLTPEDSADRYSACADFIAELPSDPNAGALLALPEDGFATVTLTGGATVPFYGISYDHFYVGSNGYVTFEGGDDTFTPALGAHFAMPRIAPLFTDLSAQAGKVRWEQRADRVVVTWWRVPVYNTALLNTFQIELYFDGTLRVAWLGIGATTALAGLSDGSGLPPDYAPMDLSELTPCGPRPPVASDLEVVAEPYEPLAIELPGVDDGWPVPPGALTWKIVALPAFPLMDAGSGYEITAEALPYTLVNGGRSVMYRCHDPWAVDDALEFVVDDGGSTPSGGLSRTAAVSITIGTRELVAAFTLDDDPGWATSGAWAFGVPLGGGTFGRDPTAGHTGAAVYGYNLAGDYANNLASPQWLTTTPIDCTGIWRTELRYWRWLGVEAAAFDEAKIEATGDGATWTPIWTHTGAALHESAWTQQVRDISAIADQKAAVRVRWGLGPTDATGTAPGWNVDDIEIWGRPVPLPAGDMDCSGELGFEDINPFILALLAPEELEVLYPDCSIWNADINRDGAVDFYDINPFVQAVLDAVT